MVLNIHCNAQSEILFSRNSGGLNSGTTLDLMLYDPATESTKLMIKGTVKGRGEYNAATSPDGRDISFNTYRFSGYKLLMGHSVSGMGMRTDLYYIPDKDLTVAIFSKSGLRSASKSFAKTFYKM